MACVICVYGPQTGRTEAEKEAFREEMERLAGLSDGQTMQCVAGDFNAHTGVVEPGDEESIYRKIWMGSKEQGRARTGGDAAQGGMGWQSRAPSSGRRRATKSPTGADGTRQSSTYWWCGNSSSGG